MTVLLQEGKFTLISTNNEAQPVTLHCFINSDSQSPIIAAIHLNEIDGFTSYACSRTEKNKMTKLGIYSDINTAIARLWGQRKTAYISYELQIRL